MNRPSLLSASSVVAHLTRLNGDAALGWRIEDGALCKRFACANHLEAMVFANAVAYIAHTLNHHPSMHISYGECRVAWYTHEPSGITQLDFEAATRTDALRAAQAS
jgi:4a-hydroxytetrahydrobiopterin dehydratase